MYGGMTTSSMPLLIKWSVSNVSLSSELLPTRNLFSTYEKCLLSGETSISNKFEEESIQESSINLRLFGIWSFLRLRMK